VSKHHYDKTPRQAGIEARRVRRRYPSYQMNDLRKGVVVRVYFADEERNRSRVGVEYVVRDLRTGEEYEGVQCLSSTGGLFNGSEDVLTGATAHIDGGELTRDTPARLANGDVVLLGFINGAHVQAVILGTLPHPSRAYGTTKAQGERRYTTHKNTSVETQSDGTYKITRTIDVAADTKTTITISPNGDVTIRHNSGAQIAVLTDGTVTLGTDSASLSSILDGVVTGRGVDTFTGQTFAALGQSSAKVLAEK